MNKIPADPNVLARLIENTFRFEDIVEAYAVRIDGVTETWLRTVDGWTAYHIDTGFSRYYDPNGRLTCTVEH